MFRPFWITPEGSVFTITDKNFFYPDLIRQSKEGAWAFIESHTVLFTPRLYVYLFFIVLGKFAALFSLDPVWLYVWSQFIFGVITFYATLWFIKTVLTKRYHALTLLFALGIESGPLISNLPTVIKPYWDARIVYTRNFALPHHMFAHATGMIFIAFLMLSSQKLTAKRVIGMTISGLISSISMPAYVLTFCLMTFPIWILWGILTKTLRTIVPLLIFASIVIIAPNLLFAIEFAKGPPWTNSNSNEKTWFSVDALRVEYISSILLYIPFLILFLLMLPFIWKKADLWLKQIIVVMMSWLIGPFFWLAVSIKSWFPMPGHRLTDNGGYLPAAILSAIGVGYVIGKNARLGIILLGLILIPSVILTGIYTKGLYLAQDKNITNIYPSKELWEGIMFLNTLPKGSKLMVRETYGDVIPAFVSMRVYIGAPYNYADWWPRLREAYKFYSGSMTNEEYTAFQNKYQLDYVFFGPHEASINNVLPLYPHYLKEIFKNKDTTIYAPRQEPCVDALTNSAQECL